MDLVPILATISVIATVSTLVLAVVSYAAVRTRGTRPHHDPRSTDASKVFLVRLGLPEERGRGR